MLFVTGFGKISTYTQKLKFIIMIYSHTQALSKHSNKIAINKQICFYEQLFADPVKSQRTKTEPVGPRGINGIAWGPILFH